MWNYFIHWLSFMVRTQTPKFFKRSSTVLLKDNEVDTKNAECMKVELLTVY